MAAFEIPEPLGYAYKSPIRYQAMQLINTQLPKAPNFVDGGAAYNPTDVIEVGGAGFEFTSNTGFMSTSSTAFESGASVTNDGSWTVRNTGRIYLQTNGQIVVQSTGEISVQTAGRLDIESGGALNFRDGSLVTAEDGSTFLLQDGSVLNTAGIVNFGSTNTITGTPRLVSGATFYGNSGSTVQFSGTFLLAGGTNVELAPARTWNRRNLRMIATDDPTMALNVFGTPFAGASKTPYLEIKGQTTPVVLTLLELEDLPHGQTITSVLVKSASLTGAPIISRALTYRVVRWSDHTGPTAMSAATGDAHDSSSWSTQVLDTTITITSNSTIDRAYRYGVEILNHDVSGNPSMNIISVLATGTATSLRV